MDKFERLDRELVHKGHIISLYKDTLRTPEGKIVEFDYIDADYFLHFIDDEGNNIFLDYCDILDICESKEKKEKYSEALYFKDKMLHVKIKKYCVKQRIQKNFYKVYNNCIIDSIEWIKKVPHLRIITQNDRVKCINMLFIEDIEDAE